MLTIPDFTTSKVLVLGDVMLDRYWHGKVNRISPEAPVPVVKVEAENALPGGAGNVALNIASLNGCVDLIGCVGDDEMATQLETTLQTKSVNTHLLHDATRPTITKLRIISQQQQLIRLDFENTTAMADQAVLLNLFTQQLSKCDVIILSDYHKGTIGDPQPFIQAAKAAGKIILIDPKGEDFSPYRGATLIKPNRKEFERVMGTCRTDEELIARGEQALLQFDLQALLVTCGEGGMILFQQSASPVKLSAKAQEVSDVTGAGDTVIAVLATSLAAGSDLLSAVKLANIAASISVSKLGAATVSVAELRRFIQQNMGEQSKIVDESTLQLLIEDAKAHGETIVMTNGCFDILHSGHVAYLNEAKQLGQRLIVAVNEDASVRELKGEARPINSVTKRMEVLAGLASVDWLVPFAELTPKRIIELLQPDVLVKGGDYLAEDVVGGDSVVAHGGKVIILQFKEGCSTTSTINRIKQQETVE